MAIREALTISNGDCVCNTVVNIDGMRFTVSVNEIIHEGQPGVLDGEFEYDVQDTDERISLSAWLVRLKDTGELSVLVDECLPGMRGYRWGDENIEMILPLINANVQPGVTNLNESDFLIHRVLKGEGDG